MKPEDPREKRRRPCPHCGKPIMALATLCAYCWQNTTPVALDRMESETFPDTASTPNTADKELEYQAAPRRDCPACGNSIMAGATLCKFCWTRVTPAA